MTTPSISNARPSVIVGLFAGLLAAALVAPTESKSSPASVTAQQTKAPVRATTSNKPPGRHPSAGLPASARKIYEMTWGVDSLSVQMVESGQLVRFSYRVTDATKAQALNDKASSPSLLDEKAHAVLQVPNMEKVGPLRQSTPAEVGKSYWMVFSNKGGHVKQGHLVSVVIGQFRVDRLVVQ